MRLRTKIPVIIFCGIAILWGSHYVIQGAFEVYDTQHNKVDDNTMSLNPEEVYPYCTEYPKPCIDNPHVFGIVTIFKTNDIFAVNNPIEGNVLVTVNDPQNINQTIGIVVSKKSDTSWINDQEKLKQHIQFFSKYNMTIKGKLQEFLYNITYHYTPPSDEVYTVLVFLHANDTDKWFSYNNLDFPNIAPVSAWVQLKNSRIVEGLTWVIVGFIPIGLVAEFVILYSVENYFHNLDKSKDNPKFSRLYENPNRYHDG